mmetsp:Transcript_3787/g.9574  ORF Transcript_3787/g.9574 Transcript_3787/m.9574 type:complete len:206 (+) Transcript_3787:136-753(+)
MRLSTCLQLTLDRWYSLAHALACAAVCRSPACRRRSSVSCSYSLYSRPGPVPSSTGSSSAIPLAADAAVAAAARPYALRPGGAAPTAPPPASAPLPGATASTGTPPDAAPLGFPAPSAPPPPASSTEIPVVDARSSSSPPAAPAPHARSTAAASSEASKLARAWRFPITTVNPPWLAPPLTPPAPGPRGRGGQTERRRAVRSSAE